MLKAYKPLCAFATDWELFESNVITISPINTPGRSSVWWTRYWWKNKTSVVWFIRTNCGYPRNLLEPIQIHHFGLFSFDEFRVSLMWETCRFEQLEVKNYRICDHKRKDFWLEVKKQQSCPNFCRFIFYKLKFFIFKHGPWNRKSLT